MNHVNTGLLAASVAMPVVRMAHIGKQFKDVVALSDVSFQLAAGEVRALVGENGAGKSTLMNILYGMYSASSGSIQCFGKQLPSRWTSIQAIRSGIGMIHQHFSSVPVYTVLENVVLPTLRWTQMRPDWRCYAQKVEAIAHEYDFHLDMHQRAEDLSVGQKQQLEILKVLYQGAKILILDEPTGVLTPQQAENLLNFLLELKGKGVSVVLVTHKLEEAMQVCDSITVLRGGRHVDTVAKSQATPHTIARMMVERDYIAAPTDNPPPAKRVPALGVRGLTVPGEGPAPLLQDATFTVHKGEIVGVAGVSGNGQAPLAEAIVGLLPAAGSLVLNGQDMAGWSVRRRRAGGLGYIPEDRHRSGLVLEMTVAQNMILDRLNTPPFARRGLIQPKNIAAFARQNIEQYKVKTPGAEESAGHLSGGNQQKVVLARTLSAQPQVIVACQPTWGLDFGATEFVRNKLLASARDGAGILLISSDLDELLALSHHILVLYRGRIIGRLPRSEVDLEQLGLLMTGLGPQTGREEETHAKQ